MARIVKIQVVCSGCRLQSTQTTYYFAYARGFQDLDSRPPSELRFMLPHQIQYCPGCGYCAPNLADKLVAPRRFLFCETYRQQLHDPNFPIVANHYLCFAMLAREGWEFKAAIQATLAAAWCCDDQSFYSSACYCRKMSLNILQLARDKGQEISTQPGMGDLLQADLLRRCQRFDEAYTVIHQGMRQDIDTNMRQVYEFELLLINHKDYACHNLQEIIGRLSSWQAFLFRFLGIKF